VRAALVVTQVALSLVLLIAAGLSVRTLRNAGAIDTGYLVDGVLTARIDLGKQSYDETRGRIFQQALLERLHALPGVHAAGLSVTLPLNDSRWETRISREVDDTRVQTFQNFVSPQYLAALGVPLLGGRQFSDHDTVQSPAVAIVNQTLARQLWPNESPLGKRLRSNQTAEIIGVVQDIKGRNLFESPGPMLYLPLSQHYQSSTIIHVRTSGAPSDVIGGLRREIEALDRSLPVYSIKPLSEHVAAALTPQRLLAHLVTSFGLLALLLAGIGQYGLLAYTVAQRTPEIGIRTALGAQKSAVVRLVVAQGMRLSLVGIGLGLVVALGVTRLLTRLLFGVSPLDPLTFIAMALLLLIVALVACALPARRAANVDPKTALRYE
jgi:predicted permease